MDKLQRYSIIILVLFLMVMPWMVSAVVLPPSEPIFEGLKLTTAIDAVGGMSTETALVWELSSEILGANLMILGDIPTPTMVAEPPLNPDAEVQSRVTYSEDTKANIGIMSYRKTSTVDTHPQVGNQYNIENIRLITFTGIGAGTILSSEDMVLSAAGTCTRTPFTCPFSKGEIEPNPPFCGKVQAGSDLDMSRVSAFTSAGIRNVNKAADLNTWPPIPTADEGAKAQYQIQVTTMGGDAPSIGSVSAYLKISESDGRSEFAGCPLIFQQIDIDEFRSISGKIDLFEYQVNYESKIEQAGYIPFNSSSNQEIFNI